METDNEREILSEPYPIRPSKEWLERNRQGVIAMAEAVAKGEEKVAAIKFGAEVKKVQTTTDGGIRLTLDLPEQAREVMSDLAECQQNGVYLTIEAYSTIEAIETP